MKKEPIKNKEMDQLVKRALKSADELIVPDQLTGLTIRRYQKKILLKELITELALKAGIAAGSLAVLAGALIWSGGLPFIKNIYNYAVINKPILLLLLSAILGIIIIDQIILRYLNTFRESSLSGEL